MKLPACHHGYEYLYQCPTCSVELRGPESQQAPIVRPRNRAERRALDSFLRRNPNMRP